MLVSREKVFNARNSKDDSILNQERTKEKRRISEDEVREVERGWAV